MDAVTLSPSPRTTVNRGRDRAVGDRRRLLDLLGDGLVAHLGVVAGDHPVVLPVAYAVDADGPDAGGPPSPPGSGAAGGAARALAHDGCVTVTELDGLVAARSGFHHSMNYRSAVVIGRARRVENDAERLRALDAIVDHMIPGRSATLRRPTRKELTATVVLAVPLAEASMKARAGGPVDDEADVAAGGWAGVIPLRRASSGPVAADDARGGVPADVLARANRFR